MESKLYNIQANTLRPGPTLTIVQQSAGKTTATMDFTCRKFDVGKTAIKTKLAKGTNLLTLYPEAGTNFDYLILDSWTSRDEPGGITTVTCEFSGVDPDEASIESEASITYTRNNALRDESIFAHEDFLALNTDVRDAIKAASDGLAYWSTGGEIKRNTNDEVIGTLSSADDDLWYDRIVRREQTTYLVGTSEWTKSATAVGQLTSASLANLGKIVTPPGSPAAPTGHTWLLTGATESIQVLGDGANSYSLTYTSGKWDADIYGS